MNRITARSVAVVALNVLLISSSGAFEQGVMNPGPSRYSCEFSPAEIIADLTSQVMEADPDATLNFKVTVTTMKKNQVLVKSIEGLPGNEPVSEGTRTSVLTVPFSAADFQENSAVDVMAFENYVRDTLRRLEVPDDADGFSCGGFPPETIITESHNSCLLGNVTTEYVGGLSDGASKNHWVVKNSSLSLSTTAECS